MSGHLCLKWNNHSSAFLRNISNIHLKEKYCDATIACQGTFFPVHRIVLSTCSEYFDEIFERMQCQHPYIIFKDIEPKEMEMLLSYMYEGEVNVLQEMLPSLIKAAEALQIKGLAVPDNMPNTMKDSSSSSSKKRSSSNIDSTHIIEERKRRNSSGFITVPVIKNESPRNFSSTSSDINFSNASNNLKDFGSFDHLVEENEIQIKEEPPELGDLAGTSSDLKVCSATDDSFNPPSVSGSCLKKNEPAALQDQFEEQARTWNSFVNEDPIHSVTPSEIVPHTSQASPDDVPMLRSQSRIRPGRLDSSLKKCSYCSYTTTATTQLKNHMAYKHCKGRRFPCFFCPKRFVKQKELTIHLRVHTGEKPFECAVCSKTFRQKIHLKVHLATVHA